jgi:hypothetical protein
VSSPPSATTGRVTVQSSVPASSGTTSWTLRSVRPRREGPWRTNAEPRCSSRPSARSPVRSNDAAAGGNRFTQTDDAFLTDPPDPRQASGRLDFGWWASNGPTGGYLARLSLEEASRVTGADTTTARRVDLHVLRLAAADDFETSVEVATGPSGLTLVTLAFHQARPFAVASVYFSPTDGSASREGGQARRGPTRRRPDATATAAASKRILHQACLARWCCSPPSTGILGSRSRRIRRSVRLRWPARPTPDRAICACGEDRWGARTV